MEDHYIIFELYQPVSTATLTKIEQKLRQSIQLSNRWNISVLIIALHEATPPPKLKQLQSET